MIPTAERVAFLRKIHLFHDLKDEELERVAGKLSQLTRKAGKQIIAQDSEGDSFFLIYSGKVKVTRSHNNRQEQLAVFVSGDYFGEEALFARRRRSASVSAVEDTTLLTLPRHAFLELLKQSPKLRPNFDVTIKSRRLARSLQLKWVRDDEVIYFIARKHSILLMRALSGPAFSLLLPLFLIGWSFVTGSIAPAVVGVMSLFLILGWGVWNAIDWGNDYYIVTNQRVVWLEKVIGIYDSRQEAPLSTILSVGAETDMTGRLLDYGNVVVRTFVGKIPFNYVAHPYQAAHMIEEQWNRAKHVASRAEKEVMKNVLRQKMGLTTLAKTKEASPQPEKLSPPSLYRRSILRVLGTNWFKLRIEDGGMITYRKHWYVLVQHIWQPSVFILIILAMMIYRIIYLISTPGAALIQRTPDGIGRVDTMTISLPLLVLPFILWWIYQYMDWSNDIFQVTNDQILDIDRKPFGTEERRAAPLENILSTEYKRRGLTGYLFNFGTVYITVGGTQLAFEDVFDPASVQADIDRRRMARMAQRKETEASVERERMADWLATYHENIEEFEREQGSSGTEPKTE